ncbi:hypothetical protein COCCADRAFT_113367 [Bipolaris zeicola 26-R-13]|uniref:Uncharacterized protein n=1 Tax=Cochliobolus carbonum (strain 26-R-13) TaxID=930089 RepID=W6XI94_COCC2|nr:uncharacterized protein COCCADRAFT_113367 [Bipolaris zeicola 26-R-13]EUC26792.1 hypothetical protein COCCADRAFT_113367 [Bipolaris zeicola 26-R-13]
MPNGKSLGFFAAFRKDLVCSSTPQIAPRHLSLSSAHILNTILCLNMNIGKTSIIGLSATYKSIFLSLMPCLYNTSYVLRKRHAFEQPNN